MLTIECSTPDPVCVPRRTANESISSNTMMLGALWRARRNTRRRFSSLSPTHFFGDGTPAPTRFAAEDELLALAEVARAKPPRDGDGLSYLPTLLGRAQTNRHEFFYWEFHERGFQQAVRNGDWKAVRNGPSKPIEIYDLKTDAAESKNLASEKPDLVAKAGSLMKSARTDHPAWPLRDRRAGNGKQ